MSPRLKAYIAAVTVAAAALLAMLWPQLTATDRGGAVFWHYGAWVAICVISESLWLTTVSGSGTVTMASSAGLASAMLWGQGPATWIVAVSTVIAELFVLKKPPVRVLFNTSQITITMWMAGGAFALLGGPRPGLESMHGLATGELLAARLLVPTLGLFAVYLLVNRALVAVAVAWSTERGYLRVLREDWFYTERLLEDGAAFLMSPLMVMSFKTVGYAGVGLFYAPLKIFNESHRRFIELKSTQQQMIHSERMAAKGEMAAEIGHELRNQLVAISGRAQMLIKDAERAITQNVSRHAQIILDQTKRMEQLANGLMGFSHTDLKIEKVDLNQLIHRSIEFVRAQNRFDGVDWDLRLCEPAPELRADPGQLQQVLLNLFMNAADAMKETTNGHRKVIAVSSERDERVREFRVRVTDTGPGITKSNLAKIFEPHFTTKATGHGFGLSTSYRIIANHGGKLTAESPPGQGATFLVTLPLPKAGSWN
jgi:signal transduction histidine kinase